MARCAVRSSQRDDPTKLKKSGTGNRSGFFLLPAFQCDGETRIPKLKGSAPASGAVFHARAENIERTKMFQASVSGSRATAGREGASGNGRGGRAPPTSEFGPIPFPSPISRLFPGEKSFSGGAISLTCGRVSQTGG
jgi:hypothetical protein